MSAATKEHGVIVGVDGSNASHAAVCRAAHDAALRRIPLALVHVVTPIVAGWATVPLPARFALWQENQARTILDHGLKIARDAMKAQRPIPIDIDTYYSATIPRLSTCPRMPS
jgi:nucleotide-binding universal stress UspA family protein